MQQDYCWQWWYSAAAVAAWSSTADPELEVCRQSALSCLPSSVPRSIGCCSRAHATCGTLVAAARELGPECEPSTAARHRWEVQESAPHRRSRTAEFDPSAVVSHSRKSCGMVSQMLLTHKYPYYYFAQRSALETTFSFSIAERRKHLLH